MATNKRAKGDYYAKRTLQWLVQELGFTAVSCEHKRAIPKFAKDGTIERWIFRTCDLWGADLIWRSETAIGFVQVKSNRGHIAAGKHELSNGPWPPSVERWVVYWPPRTLLKHGPEIHEVGA